MELSLDLAGATNPRPLLGKRLIHGRGKPIIVDEVQVLDWTESRPAKPARLMAKIKRETVLTLPDVKSHSNYKPAKVYDLGADQCRFVISDDNTMCGAKTSHAWCCAEHAAVVFNHQPKGK